MNREPYRQTGSSSIEVLFCADPGYYRHAAVAAVSLAENNRRSRTNVHVLTCAEDAAAEGMLSASLAGYAHVNLIFHHVRDARLGEVFIDRHLTREAYLRFLAPEILPMEVSRVLYLDCDLVVLDDVRSLWNLELAGKAIAAAPDFPWDPDGVLRRQRAALGLSRDDTYVNSGVLVLDLDFWRRHRVSDRLLAYAREQGSRLAFHDQDAINAVLRDDIKVIDCRWNLQARMYMLGRRSFPTEFAATRNARERPAILHYTTADKPWHFRSLAACKRHYFYYLRKTAWQGARPDPLTAPQRAEWWLGRRLLPAGIDYMQLTHTLRRAASKLWRPARRRPAGAWQRALTKPTSNDGPSP